MLGIAGDQRAHRSATDDQHFARDRGHYRAERAAGQNEPAEHKDKQDDDPGSCKHYSNPRGT